MHTTLSFKSFHKPCLRELNTRDLIHCYNNYDIACLFLCTVLFLQCTDNSGLRRLERGTFEFRYEWLKSSFCSFHVNISQTAILTGFSCFVVIFNNQKLNVILLHFKALPLLCFGNNICGCHNQADEVWQNAHSGRKMTQYKVKLDSSSPDPPL